MDNIATVPTAQRLRELLNYDPDTGKFTWLISPRRGWVGKTAGCKAESTGNRVPYIKIRVGDSLQQAHRIAWCMMTGEWPAGPLDHINGDGLDNRWCNLREVDYQGNSRNRPLNCNNKSGVIGVHWLKERNKWSANIRSNYKKIFLGEFTDLDDAIAARAKAEKELGFHPNHGRVA